MKLEESYTMFKEGTSTIDVFKEVLFEYAYNQVSRDKYIEAGDFILEFMPRADSIIKNYNPALASFRHYINRHIKWLMFSFNKKYIKEKARIDAFQYHKVADYKSSFALCEEPKEYKITNKAAKLLTIENGQIKRVSMRKRLEIFILKNARNLTTEQIDILAPLIGKSRDWVFSSKEELESKCTTRIANREYMQERHNRLFIELTQDQERLNKMKDGYEKDLLIQKMHTKRERKKELCRRIKKRNCGPKNEEIATLLQIPKGTVDSSLFYMKKTLLSLLPDLLID